MEINDRVSETQKQYDSLDAEKTSLETAYAKSRADFETLNKLRDEEILKVNDEFIAYFSAVATLDSSWRAPCPNAANGFFRDHLVNDALYNNLAKTDAGVTTQAAQQLQFIFTSFAADNQGTFRVFGNYQPDFFKKARKFTEDFLEKLALCFSQSMSLLQGTMKIKMVMVKLSRRPPQLFTMQSTMIINAETANI